MPFGMQIFNSSGGLTYSSSDVTWNQVDFFFVAADGSVANSYPVIAGKEVLLAQVFVNAPPSNRKAKAHTLDWAATTVLAYGGSEDAYVLVMMR